MNKGIILNAHDNGTINYSGLAIASALLAKQHLDLPITLITDSNTLKNIKENYNDISKRVFDNFVIESDLPQNNHRIQYDNSKRISVKFLNHSRSKIYDYSPYDETLTFDVDYFIFSDWLNIIWENEMDFMVNHKIQYLKHNKDQYTEDKFISQPSIKIQWATLMYFKKNEINKRIFELMNYIKDHYRYYCALYGIMNKTYRNDFALSMALHQINGNRFVDKSFPVNKILFLKTNESLVEITDEKKLICFSPPHLVSRIENTNIHVMNKFSAQNQIERIIKLYG